MERFNHTEQTIRVFNTIIGDYRQIKNDVEMKKRGLLYADYTGLGFVLDGLRFLGEINVSQIGSENSVNWLKSLGAKVENEVVRL